MSLQPRRSRQKPELAKSEHVRPPPRPRPPSPPTEPPLRGPEIEAARSDAVHSGPHTKQCLSLRRSRGSREPQPNPSNPSPEFLKTWPAPPLRPPTHTHSASLRGPENEDAPSRSGPPSRLVAESPEEAQLYTNHRGLSNFPNAYYNSIASAKCGTLLPRMLYLS